VEIDIQLTDRDFISMLALDVRPRRWIGVAGMVLLVGVIALVVGAFIVNWHKGLPLIDAQPPQPWYDNYIGDISLLALLAVFVIKPSMALRDFRKSGVAGRPFRVAVDDESINTIIEGRRIATPWTQCIKWKANGRIYLVYQTVENPGASRFRPRWAATIIPVRAFRSFDDRTQFERLLAAKLGQQRS
jgi:hypothetical protein